KLHLAYNVTLHVKRIICPFKAYKSLVFQILQSIKYNLHNTFNNLVLLNAYALFCIAITL
ncbi:MAG: hypothetical protein SPJ16_00825, partial [Helicobacter sp.]|uniref:hypothetical protein n=1 Tax=Helicobacter sp. TaxID=218 RepID=UPI002A91E9BA